MSEAVGLHRKHAEVFEEAAVSLAEDIKNGRQWGKDTDATQENAEELDDALSALRESLAAGDDHPPHVSLRQAADYIGSARDEIETDGLDVEGEAQFAEICTDLENTLRQLALLAEAGTTDEHENS
jgi:hypothetical protein